MADDDCRRAHGEAEQVAYSERVIVLGSLGDRDVSIRTSPESARSSSRVARARGNEPPGFVLRPGSLLEAPSRSACSEGLPGQCTGAENTVVEGFLCLPDAWYRGPARESGRREHPLLSVQPENSPPDAVLRGWHHVLAARPSAEVGRSPSHRVRAILGTSPSMTGRWSTSSSAGRRGSLLRSSYSSAARQSKRRSRAFDRGGSGAS